MQDYKKFKEVSDIIQERLAEILRKADKYNITSFTIEAPFVIERLLGARDLVIEITPEIYVNNLGQCFKIKDHHITLDELKLNDFVLYKLGESFNEALIETGNVEAYKEFLGFDSKKLHFENKTIVITDPCYCLKSDSCEYPDDYYERYPNKDYYEIPLFDLKEKTIPNVLRQYEDNKRREKDIEEWESLQTLIKGDEIPENSIINRTIYGDWSCTTYDTDTNKPIGEFCADAGEVGVFDINDLKPEIVEKLKSKPHTATFITNFTGDVWMEIEKHTGTYEEDTEYCKKGETWTNYSVHVIGKGNINFKTFQTGY